MEVSFTIKGKPHSFVKKEDGSVFTSLGDPRTVETLTCLGDHSPRSLLCALTNLGGEKIELVYSNHGQAIDLLLIDKMTQLKFSGSVLVTHENETLLQKGYGLANKKRCLSNTTDTKFRIASLSKAMTAYAVLKLVEQGALKLSQTIDHFLPSACLLRPSWREITLEMLLNHTSGIGKLTDYFSPHSVKVLLNHQPIEHLIYLLSRKELLFTPGSQFHYGHPNYLLLSEVIQQVCNNSFDRCLDQLIFQPFKLQSTSAPIIQLDDQPDAHAYSFEGKAISMSDPSTRMGTGNVISTLEDMHRWMVNWQNPNHLDPSLLQHIHLPKGLSVFNIPGKQEFYTFGWKHKMVDSHKVLYHTGNMIGCRTLILSFPKEDILIIILSNQDFSHDSKESLITIGKEIFHKIVDEAPHL